MAKGSFTGIDGCKAGWFFVSIGPGDETKFGVFQRIEKLFNAYGLRMEIVYASDELLDRMKG